MSTSRESVYAALDSERNYQRRRWGHRQANGLVESHKTVAEYLTFIRHYLTEAEKAASTQSGYKGATDMLRKVAGLCVACFEQNGIEPRDATQVVINGVDGLPA